MCLECHALVRALVLSRLDYCNGLLAKAPDYLLAQLSGVMRAAARLILQLPRKSHVYDAIRRQFHWLDISERVPFKLCVLARRCIHGSAPSYLSKYCIPVSSIAGRSHLRSAASGDLFIPATNTVTIGPRTFAVACPAAWNSLPPETPWQEHESDDVPEETENSFIQNQLVNSCVTSVLGVNRCWPCLCDFLRKAC